MWAFLCWAPSGAVCSDARRQSRVLAPPFREFGHTANLNGPTVSRHGEWKHLRAVAKAETSVSSLGICCLSAFVGRSAMAASSAMRSSEPEEVSVRFRSTATDQGARNIALLSSIQTRPTPFVRFDPSSIWPNETGIEGISQANSVIHFFHSVTGLFTKSAQSTGSENTGPERTLRGRLTPRPVNSSSRITFEFKGKIGP